ncbi:uncharacterized protein LOC143868474 [Tasmannia lanceolata]|uniref:uncharacterized protein LOC143868474 n=1 Tax=Tasmannia lanceolata TaxID=3420 RepID=UPI00406432A3
MVSELHQASQHQPQTLRQSAPNQNQWRGNQNQWRGNQNQPQNQEKRNQYRPLSQDEKAQGGSGNRFFALVNDSAKASTAITEGVTQDKKAGRQELEVIIIEDSDSESEPSEIKKIPYSAQRSRKSHIQLRDQENPIFSSSCEASQHQPQTLRQSAPNQNQWRGNQNQWRGNQNQPQNQEKRNQYRPLSQDEKAQGGSGNRFFALVNDSAKASTAITEDLVDEKTGTSVDVGKDGVHVAREEIPKGGTTTVDVAWRIYIYAASEDQLPDNRNVSIFFLEKNLQPDAKMNLHFIKSTPGATFLPRGVAQFIPFSSSKLSDILNKFLISPGSLDAKAVKETLSICEAPASKGENRYCATSLESMVDFITSKLGTNVQVLTTTVDKETATQEYTVGSGVKKMVGSKSVACHGQSYVYAVFYCHETSDTTAYTVPLVGKDGTTVEAVAVCHKDTSAWSPRFLAFQVLKVKQGSVPICHTVPQDHILWASN